MSRLPYQKVYLPSLVEAKRRDGTSVYRTGDVRMWRQSILRYKPENGLRILVFGASASAGLGFGPNVAFARQFEDMLVEAYPDRVVEVLNLSIVALPAGSVKTLLADAARRYDPDLLIVYSGNNEFMEIHAEKYQQLRGGYLSWLREHLMGLHLAQWLEEAVAGPARVPSLADQDVLRADVRQAERTIIHDVEIAPRERAAIMDAYRGHLEDMSRAASENGVPVVLSTVASNWRWRGPKDLPDDWLDDIVSGGGAPGIDRPRQALAVIDERVLAAEPNEVSGWLYHRALVHEALGNREQAREDFIAAKDADPHLRRALSAGNEAVRSVSRAAGIPVVDIEAFLSSRTEAGTIGFEVFYDNVHFTPQGALLVAAEYFRSLQSDGLLPEAPGFSVDRFVAKRLAEMQSWEEDAIDLRKWVGFGYDHGAIALRDPWKYDRLASKLDSRIEANPEDWRALAYRGNLFAHRVGGASHAARDYEAALRIRDDPELRENLERVDFDNGR